WSKVRILHGPPSSTDRGTHQSCQMRPGVLDQLAQIAQLVGRQVDGLPGIARRQPDPLPVLTLVESQAPAIACRETDVGTDACLHLAAPGGKQDEVDGGEEALKLVVVDEDDEIRITVHVPVFQMDAMAGFLALADDGVR